MVLQHLVRQGYLDLETGTVVICSQDDEPRGLTQYQADIVRQGAGAGRISGNFMVMGPNYTPFQGANGRMCGPEGEWFLAPSQGSVPLMRQLLSAIAARKEARIQRENEKKRLMLPSVYDLLKSAKLHHFAKRFAEAKHTTEGLIKATKDHAYWKSITYAAGMKPGHAARFKRRIMEYTYLDVKEDDSKDNKDNRNNHDIPSRSSSASVSQSDDHDSLSVLSESVATSEGNSTVSFISRNSTFDEMMNSASSRLATNTTEL